MSPLNKHQFPALTGMRAVAAWLVFIHHVPPAFLSGPWGMAFTMEAYVGVSIFFTLSGFLITYRYAFSSDGVYYKTYLINRFAKIYPLYFALTTVSFLRLDLGDGALYLMNISFLRGFFDELKFSGIAQGWTLTVEEIFYLLAPLLFISIRKSKWSWLAWPLGLFLMGYFYTQLPQPFHINGFLSTPQFITHYTIFGRLTEFMVGMGLAYYIKAHPQTIKSKRPIFTLVGILLFASVYTFIASQQTETTYGHEHLLGAILHNLILPLGTVLIFYGLIKEESVLSKLLSSRLMLWMGASSYAFYLLHMGIFHDAIAVFISWNWWVRFVLLNVLALLFFVGFEYPLQQIIRAWKAQQTWPERIKIGWDAMLCLVWK